MFRFFGARWKRVATVYRQKRAIGVAYGSRHFSTRGALPINRWASISLHVITRGARSTVKVRLNGKLIYHTHRARLGRGGVSTVQVGDDSSGHEFTMVVDAITVKSGASAMASPPVNTGLPAVAGLRQQGQRVGVSAGSWTGKQPIRYRYRWLRCDSRGRHCRQIAGATSRTYLLGSADVGSSLRVVVTASNSVGRATVASGATTVVQSAPASKTLPTIQGTPQDGQTLTANPGTWRGTPPITYAYRWLRCDAGGAHCAAIATGPSYVAVGADVGATLRVDVTATNSAGSATARSAVVHPAAAPPASRAAPTILGSPQEGQTLTANPGSWSGTPQISYAYKWVRCDAAGGNCLPIAGATNASYAVISADVGNTVRVQVTATNAGGSVMAMSPAVHPAASPPVDTALPAIQGTPQDGQTVTADPGSWSGLPPISYAQQWLRCDAGGANCVPIATGSSYVVVSADVGATLRVDVTATNAGGSSTVRSPAVRPSARPPANTAPPTIQGTPQNGQTLNTNPGTWIGTPPISYAYQWLRCNAGGNNCVVITGATSATYAATSGDVGSTLRIDVTATNAGGSATASSNATSVVEASSSVTVALWHMDEPAGSTTMKDSAGTDDGTLFHVTAGLAGFSGNPGDLAYGFNGSSSYVSVPSADALNPGSANVTITIHLQTTGTPPAPPADWDLFRKGDYVTGGSEFKMEFQQSGQASCGFEGSTGYSELIAGPTINDGQWHTIQCVKTSSQIEVVVDGVAYAQAADLGAISNTSPVTIGSHPGSNWYQGALDEASIQIG